jgi:hypothetical protein
MTFTTIWSCDVCDEQFAVKLTLTNRIFKVPEVVACNGVACEERWDHVDKFTPELSQRITVGDGLARIESIGAR